MKFQNLFMSIVVALLASVTVTGMVLTEQYPQAAQAEVVGFDALAHGQFGSVDGEDSGAQAQ